MVVSTTNNGTITDLPYDSVVEVSCVITAQGPVPYNWGSFPSAARGQLQLLKSMEELVIDAAVTGSYGKALQAFTVNPLISAGSKMKEMLDEMFVANKDYLPQFKDVIEKLEEKGVTYTQDF